VQHSRTERRAHACVRAAACWQRVARHAVGKVHRVHGDGRRNETQRDNGERCRVEACLRGVPLRHFIYVCVHMVSVYCACTISRDLTPARCLVWAGGQVFAD
jgi:hypothetical protein